MKKAIAYVSDIILGRSGEVISRERQREAIRAYAAANDIQLLECYEDEAYNEEVLARPGIERMMECEHHCDLVLLERVWALSRSWPVLKPILWQVREHGKIVVCTSHLWDYASQRSRDFCGAPWPIKPARPSASELAHADRVEVSEPVHHFFSDLIDHRH